MQESAKCSFKLPFADIKGIQYGGHHSGPFIVLTNLPQVSKLWAPWPLQVTLGEGFHISVVHHEEIRISVPEA